MVIVLDCRGMDCPAPVLTVRDALEKDAPATVTVRVDNEAARQNVSRYLEHQNYIVSFLQVHDEMSVVGTKGEGDYASELDVLVPEAIDLQLRHKKIMVLVSGVHMGHGDDGLGDMLMFNFIKTLKEIGPDLWRVVFVNSGVGFTAEGSEAVPILQALSDNGVQILACGACLAYFHLLDKVRVGEVTNMLEVVTGMHCADSVITV